MSPYKVLLLTCLTACAAQETEATADQAVITCPDTGCGNGSDNTYQNYLDSLPTVYLSHQWQALNIVAPVFGIPVSYINSVNFVPYPTVLVGANGLQVASSAYESNVWVWWSAGAQWTSGASADGPAISGSNFAYQVAAIVFSPSLPPSGIVAQANAALRSAGL